MKLLRKNKSGFAFELGRREKQLFMDLVQRYPLVPSAHHQIGKFSSPDQEHQRLLDEALQEHRRTAREQVLGLLGDEAHLAPHADGFVLSVTREQLEWLLQVFNDLRIGSWLALGEPDELDEPDLEGANAAHWITMEAAGYVEWHLLDALGVSNPSPSALE